MKKYLGEYHTLTEICLLMVDLEEQSLLTPDQIQAWVMASTDWPPHGVFRLEDAGDKGYTLYIGLGDINITVEP
jgi:hypothetical protein